MIRDAGVAASPGAGDAASPVAKCGDAVVAASTASIGAKDAALAESPVAKCGDAVVGDAEKQAVFATMLDAGVILLPGVEMVWERRRWVSG